MANLDQRPHVKSMYRHQGSKLARVVKSGPSIESLVRIATRRLHENAKVLRGLQMSKESYTPLVEQDPGIARAAEIAGESLRRKGLDGYFERYRAALAKDLAQSAPSVEIVTNSRLLDEAEERKRG